MFFVIFFSIYFGAHAYLGTRLVPLLAGKVHWALPTFALLFLALVFPAARPLKNRGWVEAGQWAEVVGTYWMGTFLLLVVALLAVEILTLGGFVFRTHAPAFRAGSLGLGLLLALIAMVQARRAPEITRYDLVVPTLRAEDEGKQIAVLTDLHLGDRLNAEWLQRIIDQTASLRPAAILLGGDIIDHDPRPVRAMVSTLRQFSAPLGVFAVTGNHEYYAGEQEAAALLRDAGFTLVRNARVPLLPGVTLVGVDDLTIATQSGHSAEGLLTPLLTRGAQESLLLLTHSPLGLEAAAAAGVTASFSGHTHNGQIWPFNWFVRTRFKYVYGHYQIGQLQAFVSRGVGTWGPRMRLWSPGEMVLITLRRPVAQ